MSNSLERVLKKAGIDIEELARIVNTEGGRPESKPIIYPEKCERASCGQLFFSNTQDHMMRLSNGYPTLCPTCRELDRRDKKREYAKLYKKNKQ